MNPDRKNAAIQIVTNPQSAEPLTLRMSLWDIPHASSDISGAITASGGAGGNVFSIASGPVWLSVDFATGDLSGKPDAVGHYTFVGHVEDSSGTVVEATFSINVVSRLTPRWVTPVVGEIDVPYNYTLGVDGATGTVTWSVLDGGLSAGLSISGEDIGGTPTSPDGTSYATLRATDSGTGETLDVPISITIQPALSASTIGARVATGVSTVIPIEISGGVEPYSVSVRDPGSGEPLLPPGLRIVRQRPSGRLVVGGTPGAPVLPSPNGNQTYLRTVDITDAVGAIVTVSAVITILGNPFTLGTLHDGTPLPNRSAVNLNLTGSAVRAISANAEQATVELGLPDSGGLSVLGRAANTTGEAQDIPATTDDRVLARAGGAIVWTQVTPAMLAHNAFDALTSATVYRGDGRFMAGVTGSWSATSFQVSGNQVVGARNTGWGAPSGLPVKTAWTAYSTPGTISSTYSATVASQLTTALAALDQIHHRVVAIEAALTAHGLIGP